MNLLRISPTDTLYGGGWTHKVVLKAADVVALTKATQYSIFPALKASATFAAGTRLVDCLLNVTTAGVNGNTLTLSLGDSGSATRFLSAKDLKTATRYQGTAMPYPYTSASHIDIQIDTAGTDLTGVTALVAEIYLKLDTDADAVKTTAPIAPP